MRFYRKRNTIRTMCKRRLAVTLVCFAVFSLSAAEAPAFASDAANVKNLIEDFEDEVYASYDGIIENADIDASAYQSRFYNKVLKYTYTNETKDGFSFSYLSTDGADPNRNTYDARIAGEYVTASVDFKAYGIKETGKTLYLRYGNEKSNGRWFINFEISPNGALTVKTYLANQARMYWGGSSDNLTEGGFTIARNIDLSRMHNLKIVLYKDGTEHFSGLGDGLEKGSPDIVGIYLDGNKLDFLDNTEQTLYPIHSPVYRVPYLRAYTQAASSDAQIGTYGVLLDNITMTKTNGSMPVAKERLKSAITEAYAVLSGLAADKRDTVLQTLSEAETLYQNGAAAQEQCDAMADRLCGMLLPPLDTYLKKVSFPSVVSANVLNMPSFSDGMTVTTVTSDPPDIITSGGKVIQPTDREVTVTVTVTLSRAGEDDVAKDFTVTVKPRRPVEINAVTYTDESGNTVCGPVNGGTLSKITVVNNIETAARIVAAIYDGEKLERVATADAADGEHDLKLALGEDGASKEVRFFVWSDLDGLKPLQSPLRQTLPVTVHVLADSIYAEKSWSSIPTGQVGIGKALKDIWRSDAVTVNNQAFCGTSTKTFAEHYMLNDVLNSISPGDLAIVSFAHNDEKGVTEVDTVHTEPPYTEGSYQAWLMRYVKEIREQGATPILVTALPRFQFGDDGRLKETHGGYVQAMKNVAAQTDCLLIDLNGYAKSKINELGQSAAAGFYNTGDTTHLSAEGAAFFANYIADCIDAFRLPISAYRR